jgi:hypothetical protein
VIVPCDHSFGWEAPVVHLGRGFFLTDDKMFMIEGLSSTSQVVSKTSDGLPPVTLFPSKEPKACADFDMFGEEPGLVFSYGPGLQRKESAS